MGGLVTNIDCPRCGEHAEYLIYPYWNSPFRAEGGICPDCAKLAGERFDEVGWPDMPEDKDWNKFPENCPCGGEEEFCPDCEGSGLRWTHEADKWTL